VLTFGFLAAVSTAGVGLAVRERLAAKETSRLQRDVRRICDRATDEIGRQAEADHALIGGACQSGFLVDFVGSSLDSGDLDGQPSEMVLHKSGRTQPRPRSSRRRRRRT
jgi:hypothetical protein